MKSFANFFEKNIFKGKKRVKSFDKNICFVVGKKVNESIFFHFL